ncbi:MAG TPA: phosphatase PAP2 family protein [Gemmatimonadaceae bacterium]|nr:phosphatase PAP2 family protein [Gemmatimonadaceae bacterium]
MRHKLAFALVLGLAAPAAPARAQPADTAAISTDPLFTGSDLIVAGSFVLGTLAAHPVDKYFAKRLQNPWAQENRWLRRAATTFNITAAPGSLIIGGTLYGVGRIGGNERMADLGLHGTEAIAIAGVATTLIKGTAGRARPYREPDNPRNFGLNRGWRHEEYRSFPSGHSTMAFAAAAAVTEESALWWPHSKWYVGTVMYGGAALVGVSRMYSNKHWASDVIMGAAFGTFAGRKVVKYHHSHPDNRVDRWLLAGSIRGGELSLLVLPGL